MRRCGRGQCLQVVAAFEQRDHASVARALGDFPELGRDPEIIVVLQAQLAQRVALVRVETGRNQHQVRAEVRHPLETNRTSGVDSKIDCVPLP